MHHLTLLFLLTLPLYSASQPPNDAASLLTFKTTADKDNKLLYTLHEHFDYCQWQGVKCQAGRVVRFSLPNHSLRGTLSADSLPRLDQLRVLVLRNNSLSGPLPDLSSLSNLRSLILATNSFSGHFPSSVVTLRKLRVLDLSFNNFSGSIPSQLCDLGVIYSLKLQFNHFSGPLPKLNQSALEFFNVSGNNFSGQVPVTPTLSKFNASSFVLNPDLCGDVVNKPCRDGAAASPFFDSSSAANHPSDSLVSPPFTRKSNHKRKNVLILIFSFAGIILFTSFICLFLTARNRGNAAGAREQGRITAAREARSPEVIRVRLDTQSNELKEKCKEVVEGGGGGGGGGGGRREKSGNLVFCVGEGKLYTLEQLMRASAEMLGRGTMGTTYKAKVDNQLILTIKRLDAIKMSGVDGEMFERHMEVVGSLRHPNLVPVRAYFQAKDERLVIYDYQPNGSVFNLIHGSRSNRAKPLHWTSCLKIAEDVAQGLAYIHQASKLIHGNIKASNILLGADFEASITDYCLATLAASSDNEDPDSARYRGPEARQSGRRATHKSDVYAFGVLLLELLSGKHPSQHPFLAPPDMPDWVKAVRGDGDSSEDNQLGMLVEIASLCSLTSPEQRPTMWQVLKMIQKVKASVSSDDATDPSRGFS